MKFVPQPLEYTLTSLSLSFFLSSNILLLLTSPFQIFLNNSVRPQKLTRNPLALCNPHQRLSNILLRPEPVECEVVLSLRQKQHFVWRSAYGHAKYELILTDVQRRRILCALIQLYRGADKSLARQGRKQSTATEDFEFHISYL